jgi:hypothetical protein
MGSTGGYRRYHLGYTSSKPYPDIAWVAAFAKASTFKWYNEVNELMRKRH